MTEERLNNCLVLHVHKCITNECDLVEIAKEFVMVMMSEGNTLVPFKLMLVILIVIISNIVSALWVHSCLHIHHIVMV